eukprot:gene17216-23728_t
MEINIEGFKPQDYPITKNKLISISKRLNAVQLFLKENYLLKNQDLKPTKLKDLYDEKHFVLFCVENNIKKYSSKLDFTSKLSELQIEHYQSGGYPTYKISLDTLKINAEKENWINDINNENNYNNNENDNDDEIKILKKENDELKSKIEELEKLLSLKKIDEEIKIEKISN